MGCDPLVDDLACEVNGDSRECFAKPLVHTLLWGEVSRRAHGDQASSRGVAGRTASVIVEMATPTAWSCKNKC
jgi:hypothetical protein